MIYIDDDSTQIAFPCTTTNSATNYVLKLTNTTTKKEYSYTLLNASVSDSYYLFNVASVVADDLDNGQYRYTIEKDNTEVECGLLQYGDYTHTTTSYDNKIDFTQYNG